MFKKNILIKIKKNIKNIRLDIFLTKFIKKFSRNKIIKVIKKGYIYINNIVIFKPNKKIKHKDIILIKKINIKKNIYLPNKKISINKVYEDKYILIINKKKNLIVHPGFGHINDTLMNKLMYIYPNIYKNIPRCGIIHRLDKNTTGLLIIAKKKNIYNLLISNLKKKKIIRIYKAIVFGNIKYKGKINKPISRNKYKRTIMSINKYGKKAITNFKIIENFNFCTYLNIKIETGRTHQIRVHMNYINHPIIGENIYTKKNIIEKFKIPLNIKKTIKNFKNQALHASTLKFNHPYKKNKIIINIPLPKNMLNLIFKLRKNNN